MHSIQISGELVASNSIFTIDIVITLNCFVFVH